MLKQLLVGEALLAVISGPGMAADMPVPPPAYPAYSAPAVALGHNWTGFYLGIYGGGAWGRSRFDFPATGTTTGNFATSGGLFGATVGIDWQYDHAVFGLEGDGGWANISGSAPCTAPVLGLTCKASDDWLATARGRFGWAVNEWLIYGTAGVAFSNVKMAVSTFPGQSSTTRTGWTAGGGIEYAFAQDWSIKVEYLHIDLGTSACSLPNCSALSQANVPFSAEIVRAGLNYRFGWGGPVSWRY